MARLAGGASNADTGLEDWFARGNDETAVWTGLQPGPAVAEVAFRISSIPREFVDERVSLRAVAGDLLGERGGDELRAVLELAQPQDARRRGAAVGLWLLASEELLGPLEPPVATGWAHRSVAALALRLAPIVDPAQWIVDERSREEAARLFLLWSGMLPAGEDATTARAMWQRHDSVLRTSALQAALAEHEHRMRVTTELRNQRAAEAAARYTHE